MPRNSVYRKSGVLVGQKCLPKSLASTVRAIHVISVCGCVIHTAAFVIQHTLCSGPPPCLLRVHLLAVDSLPESLLHHIRAASVSS